MQPRALAAILAVLAGGLVIDAPRARAQGPEPKAAAPQARELRGAAVVALTDDARGAARSLAREIYKNEALRPSLDERAARILIGEPALPNASTMERELAAAREAVARSTGPEAETLRARTLASLGRDVGAALVVVVRLDAGRPLARALRVSTSRWEGVELGATVATSDEGVRTVTWPGAVASLLPLVPLPPPLAPLAPASPEAKAPKKNSLVTSTFFWTALGVLSAAGVTIAVVATVTQGDQQGMRLQGRVVP
jgi:hypothetical protein